MLDNSIASLYLYWLFNFFLSFLVISKRNHFRLSQQSLFQFALNSFGAANRLETSLFADSDHKPSGWQHVNPSWDIARTSSIGSGLWGFFPCSDQLCPSEQILPSHCPLLFSLNCASHVCSGGEICGVRTVSYVGFYHVSHVGRPSKIN